MWPLDPVRPDRWSARPGARTRAATAICCARLAEDGLPLPPYARQVLGVNCKPPENPLPVLMPQFPPLSHWATLSHTAAEAAFAVPTAASGAPATTAPTTAARIRIRPLRDRK